MNNKDLIIVALATFCLTATLFTILPTRSATNPYDPWLDTNDDGLVNMRDITAAILSFGTSGDTTKNVNVTNWPLEPQPKAIIVADNITLTFPPTDTETFFTSTNITGYRFVSVLVSYYTDGYRSINVYPSCLGIRGACMRTFRMDSYLGWFTTGLVAYEIGAPYVDLSVLSEATTGGGILYLTVALYCYN